jgi:aminoglycoside 3-N-acetyltransferase
MDEDKVIKSHSGGMSSAKILREGLMALGVKAGDTLLVHTSLSKLGWVPGGAQTVAETLVSSVGNRGLICVPTFSSQNTDPANWQAPPVPQDWHDEIRATMPPFRPAYTLTRSMGAINDVIRSMPDAVRNGHPFSSFAAIGKNAERIVSDFTVAFDFDEHSPLARLYDANANVLFLGTGFANCTCFHLGEHRAGKSGTAKGGTAMMVDGQRKWVSFDTFAYCDDDFETLGNAFETHSQTLRKGKVGQADCQLFSLCEAVDFAQKWILENR